MSTVTRFAPSPTGYLHIGGVRTAFFNWLYSKQSKGKFYLRIEDTDKERSTESAVAAIIDGLKWLGIDYDHIIYQSQRKERHIQVARQMLDLDKAYKCYSTKQEIEEFHSKYPKQKFISSWRNKQADGTKMPYTIRLKADFNRNITINDNVQGEITVAGDQLDDMILVRSDNTPTYMLAVVVDDHDMGVNYILRGDDHLTNSFRQVQIYYALGWDLPQYAHIPLIHGDDGKKLSKRHGALSIAWYKEQGYLPEAVLSYLLKLGWSNGDDSIITLAQAKQVFTIKDIGASPACFDLKKLNYINAYYIVIADNNRLFELLMQKMDAPKIAHDKIFNALNLIKPRAATLNELSQEASIFVKKAANMDEKSQHVLQNGGQELLPQLLSFLTKIDNWKSENLKQQIKIWTKENNIKFAFAMQTLRAGIVATFNSPAIMEIMEILGKEETIKRMMI